MSIVIADTELDDLEAAIKNLPQGAAMSDLVESPGSDAQRRAVQRRLKKLLAANRIRATGAAKGRRYFASGPNHAAAVDPGRTDAQTEDTIAVSLSKESLQLRQAVRRPEGQRKPVGYNRDFLSSYRPNVSFYLPDRTRRHLAGIGKIEAASDQPAGTYARQILDRLLIDLSWNSSRLEGNTYSLLDTHVLLEQGKSAAGKSAEETQMILNHKDAIEFLVDAANEIGFNRSTVLNLHALLSNNLLANPEASGRLRRGMTGIGKSVYTPLQVPALIEECFAELLAKAQAIADPFEQSLFVGVHIPYLQAFEDVNKRVSRLAANIPFIKRNLSPISFLEVPQRIYAEAMLAVYELNRIELVRDMFVWAYERSALRYAAIQQSLGQPDPFRLRYREQLRDAIAAVVREKLGKTAAAQWIVQFAGQKIAAEDRARFAQTAEVELIGMHEGNFARYRLLPSEFFAWKAVWEAADPPASA